MSDGCENQCVTPPAFPRDPENRPGLPRLAYRAGTYAEIREWLLWHLDRDPVLRPWTHREPDDPGIALLEGAAVLGDILTFYQEQYANEAYLRTARWKESISDLVRLTGYRLAPGLGGKGTAAFEVEGERPVVVPAAFPLRAPLEEGDQPAVMETVREMVARPALSRFQLYRRGKRSHSGGSSQPALGGGTSRLEVEAVAGSDGVSVDATGLRSGDRVMVLPISPAEAPPASSFAVAGESRIVVVERVERKAGRVVLMLRNPLEWDLGEEVLAYRVGRSFRHFGHDAPAEITRFSTSGDPPVVDVSTDDTEYERPEAFQKTGSFAAYYPDLNDRELPIPGSVDDLSPGARFILRTRYGSGASASPSAMVLQVTEVRSESLSWGHLTGPVTVLVMDKSVNDGAPDTQSSLDIRHVTLHEITGPALTLGSPPVYADGSFEQEEYSLDYRGLLEDAAALKGRRLFLVHRSGRTARVTVTDAPEPPEPAARPGPPARWKITLDAIPEEFTQADFDDADPAVTALGNLVDVVQGEAEGEVTLGSGDAREAFQTFALPNAPLTHLRDPDETPPAVPRLEVRVEGRLWRRVDSLFGRGPSEEVYIVRQDRTGSSWVQFGDGRTGKRLPSGPGNVTARYWTGTGARGPVEPDASVQAGQRLDRLVEIGMPEGVAGGDNGETGETAREAAPGRVQSLGRLVSLADYEAGALATPGVSRVRARWSLDGGAPVIAITLLMGTGRGDELDEVAAAVARASRCRGTRRFPVRVEGGRRIYVQLVAAVAVDPALKRPTVLRRVKEALGVQGEEGDQVDGSGGLFGDHRRFAEPEYATRILAVIQQVEGVRWAEIEGLERLEPADQGEIPLPDPQPASERVVSCPQDGLLALHTAHLRLTVPSEPAREEC